MGGNNPQKKYLETDGEFNQWFRKMELENIREIGDKEAEEYIQKEWEAMEEDEHEEV